MALGDNWKIDESTIPSDQVQAWRTFRRANELGQQDLADSMDNEQVGDPQLLQDYYASRRALEAAFIASRATRELTLHPSTNQDLISIGDGVWMTWREWEIINYAYEVHRGITLLKRIKRLSALGRVARLITLRDEVGLFVLALRAAIIEFQDTGET